MIEISTQPISTDLVIAQAKPDQEAVKDLDTRAQATIVSLLGDKNQVWLGRPEAFDLLSLSKASGKELPATLMLIMQTSDLVVIQLACSFRPAPQCQFVRATVRVWLECEASQADQPIAYDLFPREVVLPVSYKRTLSVSPELKLGFEKVSQLEASAFSLERSRTYVVYEPEIISFGVGDSCPGWDFNKTVSRPIRGVKDLFILVKKPRSIPLKVRFDVSAWVQTYIGKIPLSTFFLSGSDKPLIQESFVLI